VRRAHIQRERERKREREKEREREKRREEKEENVCMPVDTPLGRGGSTVQSFESPSDAQRTRSISAPNEEPEDERIGNDLVHEYVEERDERSLPKVTIAS
jgi:hypothetical protein